MLVNSLGSDVRFLASEKSNYDHFVSKTGITLPLVNPSNFTEMVTAIQGCKLFVGTLSAPLAIADALHKKRIALQQSDNDSRLASNTNSSFVTCKHSLTNLI
jgi:ADP-heptose:LPS heptosyltransferase